MLQTLTTPNGVLLANETGTKVTFDHPKVIEALEYWVNLTKQGVHPAGVVEWGTTPKDFFEKKAAIMVTTTGNLTNVRKNAQFDFGVGQIAGNLRKGSPTGGGNFYIFKKAPKEQQEAAFKFIQWITYARSAPRSGAWTPATWPCRPQPMTPPRSRSMARTSRRPWWRVTSCPCRWPSFPRTTTSA